jgi:hypothetical protein
MAIKKESKKSADAGWLLEVGVIGIDKTLKIIRQTRLSLLEIESYYRRRSSVDDTYAWTEKLSLPWIDIKDPIFDKTVKDREWKIYYPATFQAHDALKDDCKIKKQKGGNRKPLNDWRLNGKNYEIIKANGVGYDSNFINRVRAESLILWDAIRVMNGELKSMPRSYPDKKTQSFYGKKNQDKVRQIIQECSLISEERKLLNEKKLNEAKIKLKNLDNERIDLITEIDYLNKKLKKWGSKKK